VKKSLISALALLLLINTVGIHVYAHYCGNDITKTSVLVNLNAECCSDEVEEANDCCHDQISWLQMEQDFITSALHAQSAIFLPVEFFSTQSWCNAEPMLALADHQIQPEYFLPPGAQHRFLSLGVFRI
jgi:hypothetical protein